MNGYEELANAIIMSAVKDYRRGGKKQRKEIEEFILSDWFRTLTDINSDFLIRKLREE